MNFLFRGLFYYQSRAQKMHGRKTYKNLPVVRGMKK